MKKMIDNETALQIQRLTKDIYEKDSDLYIDPRGDLVLTSAEIDIVGYLYSEGSAFIGGQLTADNGIYLSDGTIFSVPSASNIVLRDDNTNLEMELAAKQDKLISGTNIKTINGTSLLGSGNIPIEGGGEQLPFISFFIRLRDRYVESYFTFVFTDELKYFLLEGTQELIDNLDTICVNPNDWGYDSGDELVEELFQPIIDNIEDYSIVGPLLATMFEKMSATAKANVVAGGVDPLLVFTAGFEKPNCNCVIRSTSPGIRYIKTRVEYYEEGTFTLYGVQPSFDSSFSPYLKKDTIMDETTIKNSSTYYYEVKFTSW